MMLNEIRNKVLGGEKITVEEARWLSCQAEKQDLYDAAHEITRVLASRKFDMCSIINVHACAFAYSVMRFFRIAG